MFGFIFVVLAREQTARLNAVSVKPQPGGKHMRFEDRDDGDYRIHAGSLELRAGQGHLAAVIVNSSSDGKIGVHEVYRDTEASGGHRWLTSDQALQHALQLGASAVAAERNRTTSQNTRACLNARSSRR